MQLNTIFLESLSLTKSFHTLISGTFAIIAVWLVVRSVLGIVKKAPYTKLDKYLSYGFIINLYLQLIFGLLLFANPNTLSGSEMAGVEGALKMASKRFWPIEHIVMMLFALLIANLGLIFSSQTQTDKDKHIKVLVYYMSALILIAISLGAN